MARKRKQPAESQESAPDASAAAPPAEQEPATKKKKTRRANTDDPRSQVEAPAGAETASEPGKKAKKAKKGKKSPHQASASAGSASASEPPSQKGKSRNARKRAAKRASNEALTVILGGFPYSVTEGMLRKDFGKCGKIQKLNMPKDQSTGHARGFAFITFAAQEGLDAALKFNGKDYMGRRVSARVAGDKPDTGKSDAAETSGSADKELTVFVAGLPRDIGAQALREYFSEAGKIMAMKLPRNDAGKPKGFAFISYSDKKSVKRALKFNGNDFDGCSLVVRASADEGGKGPTSNGESGRKESTNKAGPSKPRGDPELTVFVSGLPYFTKEKELRKRFSKCGEIASLKLPMCSWDESQSRGFAFISFKDKASAENALQLDGKEYEDRYMSVKMASDPASKDAKDWSHKGQDKEKHGKEKKRKAEPANHPLTAEDLKSDRERGVLVKATGKQVVFESDDDE